MNKAQQLVLDAIREHGVADFDKLKQVTGLKTQRIQNCIGSLCRQGYYSLIEQEPVVKQKKSVEEQREERKEAIDQAVDFLANTEEGHEEINTWMSRVCPVDDSDVLFDEDGEVIPTSLYIFPESKQFLNSTYLRTLLTKKAKLTKPIINKELKNSSLHSQLVHTVEELAAPGKILEVLETHWDKREKCLGWGPYHEELYAMAEVEMPEDREQWCNVKRGITEEELGSLHFSLKYFPESLGKEIAKIKKQVAAWVMPADAVMTPF